MSTLAEIEVAVEGLPASELKHLQTRLAERLQDARKKPPTPEQRRATFEAWLETAVGVSRSGMTTEQILARTRGEE